MQVVSLTTPYMSGPKGLRGWPSIQHLDLRTDVATLLQNINMQVLVQLKTLNLQTDGWTTYPPPMNRLDLDLTCARSLRRLHIESWSPRSIKVATGCQVFAKWQCIDGEALEWLRSPCWRSTGINLVALHVEDKQAQSYGPDQVEAIRTIIECHDRLEAVVINTVKVGSEEMPLNVTSGHHRRAEIPLSVEITTSEGCWLHLGDTSPLSKALVLKTKGPLHVKTPVSRLLRWFALEGPSASSDGKGSSSLQWQLAEAMYKFYANSQDNPNMEDGAANHGNHDGAAAAGGATSFAAECAAGMGIGCLLSSPFLVFTIIVVICS